MAVAVDWVAVAVGGSGSGWVAVVNGGSGWVAVDGWQWVNGSG
jgi:hypothetical protein